LKEKAGIENITEFEFEKNIIGPCITQYIFPDEFNCIFFDFISKISEEMWQPATIQKNQYNNGLRICDTFFVSSHLKNNDFMSEFDKLIFLFFKKSILDYSNDHDIFIKNDEGYHVLRYKENGVYHKHTDAGGLTQSREVSCIMYLNDDYQGGELEFTKFDLKIKPKKNSILLFPSNYAYEHIAHKVINGNKFCIVTWFHPFKD